MGERDCRSPCRKAANRIEFKIVAQFEHEHLFTDGPTMAAAVGVCLTGGAVTTMPLKVIPMARSNETPHTSGFFP